MTEPTPPGVGRGLGDSPGVTHQEVKVQGGEDLTNNHEDSNTPPKSNLSEVMRRSSSQIVNNAAGGGGTMASASLNPSTQSFETTYQPPTSSDTNIDLINGIGVSPPTQGIPGASSMSPGESRIVCVSGIDPSTPDSAILEQFECFGDIHSISSNELQHSGYVVIVYHDIRAARLAMHSSGTQWRGRQLSCTMLDESVGCSLYNTPMTTLYLVSLEYGGADIMDDIFYLLSAYGELKELKRDVHSRPHCCLAEFYDSRHAVSAFSNLQSVEGLSHRLLVLDAREVGPAGVSGMGQGALPPSHASTPFHLSQQAIQQFAVGSHPPPMVHSASTPSSFSYSYPQPTHKAKFDNFGSQQATKQSIDDVLTKNLSEMSLESMHGFGYHGQAHQSFHSLQQHSLDQIWKEPGSSSDVRSRATLSSSPPSRSSLFGGVGIDASGSVPSTHLGSAGHQNVLAALQAQQRALQTQQMHVQNSAAIQLALGGAGGVVGGMSGGMVGSSHQHIGKAPPQYSRVGATSSTARRNHSDPALGGRLARNKMNPVAEAERRAHQDRMYGLNLSRIASGEDKRTTLMIKNIPNKYTQKMLLALLEERFAGIYPFPFDFFYLPIDFKNKCNVGYAFINMTTPHAIPSLVEDFHGKRWPKFNSEKVCAIAYGRIQGKLSLIQHFQNSSLLHEDKRCRPVLFNNNGEIEAFPIGPAALANFSLKQHAMEVSRGKGDGSSPSL